MEVHGRERDRIVYKPKEYPEGHILDDSKSTCPYKEIPKGDKERKGKEHK